MKRIGVFCGSSSGARPDYRNAATELVSELVEMLTWTQLGIHHKPCGLLNTHNYYDTLLDFFDRSVGENFVQPEHRSMLLVEKEPASLLDRLESWKPPVVDKTNWILDLEDG